MVRVDGGCGGGCHGGHSGNGHIVSSDLSQMTNRKRNNE